MTPLEPGAVVGHYRLVRRLGSGGMGAVYLGQDLTLDRPVAIKFLNPAEDGRTRHRVLREARAAAALAHEGIAAVHEVGHDPAAGDFIVMQYVDGETLAARLQRGPLTPGDALMVCTRIADALAAAHRQGIIHRDLKPHNIVLTASGAPKVLDFGLARRLTPSSDENDVETMTESVTQQSAAGTPGYMSPEQIRNQPLDGRSDLFALGCILYECLTGQRAFSGASAADVLAQTLQHEPPAPSSVVSGLGPAYDVVCARLLRKSAAERFQSADEALGAMHSLTDTARLVSSQLPHVPTGRWRGGVGPVVTVAGAVAAVALIAVLGWQWWSGAALPEPPPEAERYYRRGVEALRDGTYAGARNHFTEAVRLFPQYVQAHLGLAQASKELDHEDGATRALLTVNQLVPDRTRLPTDDRLRIEAVLALVARTHDDAVRAFATLADRHKDDAGAWLDLGLAEDAAGRRTRARQHFEHAVTLDGQLAAGHVRLGIYDSQSGQRTQALTRFAEAARLYRVANNIEGEAEALLRQGLALNNAGLVAEARPVLERVVQLSTDRFLSQWARARFELARAATGQGRTEDIEAVTEESVRKALEAEMFALAAAGRIDLANVFLVQGEVTRADAELVRAIEVANRYGARFTEMRARLQQASLRVFDLQPQEALALAEVPLKFFGEGRYLRLESDAKTIMARAYEGVGQYAEALRLTREVLAFAESVEDAALAVNAWQNLAGQHEQVGHLPEALRAYQQAETIYRALGQTGNLAAALVSKAAVLVQLGRGADAEAAMAEVEAGISAGRDTDVVRPRRLARFRALRAITEGRFGEVERLAASVGAAGDGPPDVHGRWVRALREVARFHQQQRGERPEVLAQWIDAETSAATRREMTFWLAPVIRGRGAAALAARAVEDAWTRMGDLDNPEARWRLAAIAAPDSVTIPRHIVESELQKLRASWGGTETSTYLARSDLQPLHTR